jgi:SAM-dependent methyltransferase
LSCLGYSAYDARYEALVTVKMGLAKSALRFIAREHRRKPFTGPILTLGRQHLLPTMDAIRALLISEGITPAVCLRGEGTGIDVASGIGARDKTEPRDVAFFKLLGVIEVLALDFSPYEGAEIVHDLNRPAPEALHDRFDLIVDGGTTEHVFDVRQALTNIARMLKIGGRVIHISPANNWVNHGFYQFSPTLFYDYYGGNGFVDLRGYIAEHDLYLAGSRPWKFFEVGGGEGRLVSRQGLRTVFVAERASTSTADKVPIQSHYTQVYSGARRVESDRKRSFARTLIRKLKEKRSDTVKILLRRLVPGYDRRRGLGKLRCWDRL